LDLYLAEDAAAIVARNLHAPLVQVRSALGDLHLSSVQKVLTGDPKRRDGQPYQPSFVERVWAALAALNGNPELKEALEKRQPSAALAARVCHAGVATLTGRLRGRVRYSQARNTPFQGLAADGAALALFALVREGYRVVGFVHDEVLVELPDEGGFVSEFKVRRVEEILCREMQAVLVGGIPVACEAALAKRWDKKAKRVARDSKVFPWEPATENPPASAPGTGGPETPEPRRPDLGPRPRLGRPGDRPRGGTGAGGGGAETGPRPGVRRTARRAYAFEMTEADHRELLDVLRRCRGRVMLSGYPSRLYDQALARWSRWTFELPNNAAGGERKGRETEVLWMNFDPGTGADANGREG
jgi:hypothetical protein